MICNEKNSAKGFALVVTVSLLVLLSVIALGFLSLSAVTLRSGSQDQALMDARANARMALQIAIGELQKQLGPDQRISANGAITSTTTVANPHWTGVWDSWIAGPLSAARTNPNYPNDPMRESHHQTIGEQDDMSMSPDYDKNKYFRRWLVSLNPEEAASIPSARDLALDGKPFPGEEDTAIRLVGIGSTEDASGYVSARLVSVPTSASRGMGRYAWWVGDESQKARVLHDSYVSKPPANSAEKIYRGQSPGSTGTKNIKDLEGITVAQDLKLDGLPSMKTLDLVPADTSKQPAKKNFHHVTPYSSQVLADIREGGLKRDLSTLLERPIDRSEDGDEYMLYAMDDPRFSDRSHSRVPIQDLAAYYQLYNNVEPTDPDFGVEGREGVRFNSSSLANSIQISAPDFDGGSKDRDRVLREYTTLYRSPVVTKVQFMIGITSEQITQADRQHINDQIDPDGNGPQNPVIKVAHNHNATMPINDDDTHKLRMGIMPIVTLWNPNNLPMVMDDDQLFHVTNAPPVIFRWRKYLGSATDSHDVYSPFNLSYLTAGGAQLLNGAGTGYPFLGFTLAAPGGTPIDFEPGEVKIFSVADGTGTLLTDDGKGRIQRGCSVSSDQRQLFTRPVLQTSAFYHLY